MKILAPADSFRIEREYHSPPPAETNPYLTASSSGAVRELAERDVPVPAVPRLLSLGHAAAGRFGRPVLIDYRGGSLWLSPPASRHGPAPPSVARPDDQVEIAPECLMYFCVDVEPSNRVCCAEYAPTLPLVTNFRPVFVGGGATRPPDSCHRYRYSVGRKPRRYGDWSTVKSSWPAPIAVRVCGSPGAGAGAAA